MWGGGKKMSTRWAACWGWYERHERETGRSRVGLSAGAIVRKKAQKGVAVGRGPFGAGCPGDSGNGGNGGIEKSAVENESRSEGE